MDIERRWDKFGMDECRDEEAQNVCVFVELIKYLKLHIYKEFFSMPWFNYRHNIKDEINYQINYI